MLITNTYTSPTSSALTSFSLLQMGIFNLASRHHQNFRPSQGHHRRHHRVSRLTQLHLHRLAFVEVIQRVGGELQENLLQVDLEFQGQAQ